MNESYVVVSQMTGPHLSEDNFCQNGDEDWNTETYHRYMKNTHMISICYRARKCYGPATPRDFSAARR